MLHTPPSRSALDFLDAPAAPSSLLDGRFIKLLLAPTRGPARVFSAGFGVVSGAITKVLGAQVLHDVQTFVAAFDTLFGGFRQRAERTYALLQERGTAFLVVAAPEPDALREAAYFVERLTQDDMPLAGLVVNRVTTPSVALSAEESLAGAARLDGEDPEQAVVAGLLRVHAERMRLHSREQQLQRRFAAAHPTVPSLAVPALATDVHDLDGLRQVGALLAA